MAVTTRPPDPPAGGAVLRFDLVERVVHWCNAALFGALILTGATLYLSPLEQMVGRHRLVEEIHVYCGIALPVPLLLAVSGPWGRRLREDLHRWNRWGRGDRLWWRALLAGRDGRPARMAGLDVGKFNSGQKLNAAFVGGAGLVMLGTGLVMRWYSPWPLAWRTGATFVHDWLALAVGLVVIGHVAMALRDRQALRSMVTGRISRDWARRHAPAWLEGRDQARFPGRHPPEPAGGSRAQTSR